MNTRIAAMLNESMTNAHLSEAQRLLLPQMIEAAPLSPRDVMAAARNPGRICDAMLTHMADPAHCNPAAQDAFRRVLQPVLATLLDDPGIAAALQPAFQTAVAESF